LQQYGQAASAGSDDRILGCLPVRRRKLDREAHIGTNPSQVEFSFMFHSSDF
jgi:hypothetical protein